MSAQREKAGIEATASPANLHPVTVAIAVKVYDGIVLAADSATTLPLDNGSHQVYNHADKVFHLHRDLPIGAMTWGMGQIGGASISTLAKDLRRRFMGLDPANAGWKLDPDAFTIEDVAGALVKLMFDELYTKQDKVEEVGFLVGGYSAGARESEVWTVTLSDPNVEPQPVLEVAKDQAGWMARAQAEAVTRLFNGFDSALLPPVAALVPPEHQNELMDLLQNARRQPAIAPMPFADAIDLATFMVDVTVGFSRYLLGPDMVGGPVDVAGITRHEGFKWVQRKHYYPKDLNPGRPHDHDQ